MVVEKFHNFWEWLGGSNWWDSAFLSFLLICLTCIVIGLLVGYMIAVIRHGPFEAFYVCANVIFKAPGDFIGTSPRRIFAIARLAAKEAVRRRVILVSFLIFAVALLFGGWFINSGVEHPERIYINFVMWGTQLLILMMVLLISAFSLPEDIKNKTIYTVATKPVRATEIILGRILGFAGLGTALLAVMAMLSLAFVWGGLNHTHELDLDNPTAESFSPVAQSTTGRRASESAVSEAQTTFNSGHSHVVEIIKEERSKDSPPPINEEAIIKREEQGDRIVYTRVFVRPSGGHTHTASVDESGRITLSNSKGFFRSRIPIYADQLSFFDREGNPRYKLDERSGELVTNEETGELQTEGVNVGELWTYRGYIDGGASSSRAQFDFVNFSERQFKDTELLPLELTLLVFRSHTGDLEKRIRVGIRFESVPDDEATDPVFRSELIDFESDEFSVQVKGIPRKLPGYLISAKGEQISEGTFDLFDDYAKNGNLRLVLTCLDQGQYVGVARADIYFRASEGQYWINFFKGYIGIWLQMLIVIALAVSLSTILGSPVSMLVSICALIFGFFSDGIRRMCLPGKYQDLPDGGGPIESAVRLVTQQNMTTEMEDTFQVGVMRGIDGVLLQMLESLTYVFPNFSEMNFSDFVKYGYYVDNQRLLVAMAITFAFCLGVSIIAYFCFKTRELAG